MSNITFFIIVMVIAVLTYYSIEFGHDAYTENDEISISQYKTVKDNLSGDKKEYTIAVKAAMEDGVITLGEYEVLLDVLITIAEDKVKEELNTL